jgi:aspartyl-tRNA(Asn)/glutamyl-tRNA(Gln) amidotransferase subunit C
LTTKNTISSKKYRMTIDNDLILKLENLARLDLNSIEREELQKSLNQILAMIEKLNALNTEGVAPLVYLGETEQTLREDVIQHQVSTIQGLKNAPEKDAQYFKVPKVIGEKTE